MHPKGLIATEGIVTIPFEGHHPLAIRSHFFEFLDRNDQPKLAHELEAGSEYTVVLTTGTVTSAEVAEERLGASIIHQYVPLDLKPAQLDVLMNLAAPEVNFAFGDANSSALVTMPDRSDYKYVVMPMRI